MIFSELNVITERCLIILPLTTSTVTKPPISKTLFLNIDSPDLFCESEEAAGCDFVIEVKDRKGGIPKEEIDRFIRKKEYLSGILKRKTGYIFYSETGFTEEQKELLSQAGIMYTDAGKL